MTPEPVTPLALALPPSNWTDTMARRYIGALVRFHERRIREGGDPDTFVCNRLERLLGLPGGLP